MARFGKHERRRHFRGKPRAGRRVDLTYRPVDGVDSDYAEAVTRNIGVGGAYILTPEPERVGTQLRIQLNVPTSEDPIEVLAEVRWVAAAAHENDDAGMGVRFIDLAVDDVLKLSEYFASLTGAEPAS